jgi:hypothetical protein
MRCGQVERHDLSTGRKTVGKMYLVDLAGSEMVRFVVGIILA